MGDTPAEAEPVDAVEVVSPSTLTFGQEWESWQVGNATFTVPRNRYALDYKLGSGTYGTVSSGSWLEVNDEDGKPMGVAIKKIRVPWNFKADEETYKLMELRRVVRELAMLQTLSHPCVIKLFDVFEGPPPPTNIYKDLYLVMELLDTDLEGLMKDYPSGLESRHIQVILYQILCALKYLHSLGIIHRDLKPSNIVINEECSLRLVDFGLAREEDDCMMTEYVQSRWYRAPELLMNTSTYTPDIDIWSTGCVLWQMATGKVLFPGSLTRDQVHRVFSVIGRPSDEELDSMPWSEQAKKFVKGMPVYAKTPLQRLLEGGKELDPELLDLVGRMIVLDPRERIKADTALQHPFLESVESIPEMEDPPPDGAGREDFQMNLTAKGAAELHDLLSSQIHAVQERSKAFREESDMQGM